MGWFGSIHVRTPNAALVVEALQVLKQHECFVGKSGADWVGVYDKLNEEQSGTKLMELSRDLSSALSGDFVLGLLQSEESFGYWLYHRGKQLDKHPRNQIKGMLFMRRGILDICPDTQAKERVRALLNPKVVVDPVDYKMTDEELRAKIARNKSKDRPMSAGQRKTTAEQRKIYHTDRYGVEMLSKILGIEYFWQLYSDFSPYDLPPTFVHLQ
jgi:hypothetical protein